MLISNLLSIIVFNLSNSNIVFGCWFSKYFKFSNCKTWRKKKSLNLKFSNRENFEFKNLFFIVFYCFFLIFYCFLLFFLKISNLKNKIFRNSENKQPWRKTRDKHYEKVLFDKIFTSFASKSILENFIKKHKIVKSYLKIGKKSQILFSKNRILTKKVIFRFGY